MSVAADTSRLGSDQTIPVGAIERELAALWKDSAESSTKAGRGPVTRACSMTLVAPCSNAAQFDHVRGVVERAGMRNPGRAVLVYIDLDTKTERIDAQVSAVCSIGAPGQNRVCHEHVQIHASGASVAAVAPAVRALLMPDVFAFLWAPCEKLLSHGIVQDLAHDADALVLDSHRFSDPLAALSRAHSIAREHPTNRAIEESASGSAGSGFGVHDLEWARLRPWFEAVASAFDSPEAARLLPALHSIRIEYIDRADADPSNRRGLAVPALLAGWFASHLGWSLEDAAKKHASLPRRELRLERNGPRTITLSGRSGGDTAGAILNIELSAPGARLAFAREPGAETARVTLEAAGSTVLQRTAPITPQDDTDALCDTIAKAPVDGEFERALPVALAFRTRG